MKEKMTHEKLMLAVTENGQDKPTPAQDAETTKYVVAAGVAGLIGVLALINYIGKKS